MRASALDIEKAFNIVQDIAQMKINEKVDRIADLKETIKGFDGLIAIHNQTNSEQQNCIANLQETIKGLDRATVEYTRVMVEQDKTIKAQIALIAGYEKEVKDKDAIISGLNERIEYVNDQFSALNRVSNRYSNELCDKDATIRALNERIATLTNVKEAHSAMLKLKHKEVKELEERIATLLEAHASVPTRDINGTIEAQQSLISKLKRDVLTLQKKVQEQDEQLTTWKEQQLS